MITLFCHAEERSIWPILPERKISWLPNCPYRLLSAPTEINDQAHEPAMPWFVSSRTIFSLTAGDIQFCSNVPPRCNGGRLHLPVGGDIECVTGTNIKKQILFHYSSFACGELSFFFAPDCIGTGCLKKEPKKDPEKRLRPFFWREP